MVTPTGLTLRVGGMIERIKQLEEELAALRADPRLALTFEDLSVAAEHAADDASYAFHPNPDVQALSNPGALASLHRLDAACGGPPSWRSHRLRETPETPCRENDRGF